jgi:hypothetical protein
MMNSQSGEGSMHETPVLIENRQDSKNAGCMEVGHL